MQGGFGELKKSYLKCWGVKKRFVSAFYTSQLPGLRSSDLIFWVGPSLQNPEKTADKFAGSLFFWVGPSLRNLKKTAEKSEFWKFLDEPVLQNPDKLRKNPHFENFLGPLKIAGNPRKSKFQNLFIAGKPQRIFGRAHPLKSWDTAEKSAFREFFGSPKNCKKPRKNPNFESAIFSKILLKIQNTYY